MRVLILNTALDERPLDGDGEVFTGKTATDVVHAMKGATRFSDRRDLEEYIDMVVARLAGELGYSDAARWIGEHHKEYAEGVFRGFVVDPRGGKP